MFKRALMLALVVAVFPAASHAAKPQFTERTSVKPTGCAPTFAGQVVTLAGCVGKAAITGSSIGTADFRYTAVADLLKNTGTQHGTLIFHGATGGDVLVLAFKGTVTVRTGISTGTWSASKLGGTFAKLAPHSGTYTSHSPDHGVTVSFVVLG